MPSVGRPRSAETGEEKANRARKRRLSTYPASFFTLIDAAKAKQPATAVFEQHNKACAILMRYYRFRADAIEDRIEGALLLRNLQATGINADGTPFNTRRADAPGPYTIIWAHDAGLELDSNEQPMLEIHAPDKPQRQGGIAPQVGGDTSPGEKAVEEYLARRKQAAQPKQADVELAAQPTQEQSAVAQPLDIPALDASTQGEPIPPCPPHELDPLTGGCVKCRLPQEKWT